MNELFKETSAREEGKFRHCVTSKKALSLWQCPFKGTQEREFVDFDFEFCTISLLVMHK
jgi:hypothetical protein